MGNGTPEKVKFSIKSSQFCQGHVPIEKDQDSEMGWAHLG